MSKFNIDDANEYLQYHNESHKWDELEDDKKESLLFVAESFINTMDLRADVKDQLVYQHAIYEQALHLLVFDKERSKLQREGVVSYKFDDMNFTMEQSIISPVANQLLRKYIYKQLGVIV